MRAAALGVLLLFSGCAFTGGRSWKGKISPVRQALIDVAERGAPVSVAFLGTADTSYSAEAFQNMGLDLAQWKAGQVESTQVRLEQAYLRYLHPYKNAHIVDRAVTEKIMEELKFSLSGAISQAVRVKIGELTGANYLVLFRVMRFSTGPGEFHDELIERLVAVETGELLASQTVNLP